MGKEALMDLVDLYEKALTQVRQNPQNRVLKFTEFR